MWKHFFWWGPKLLKNPEIFRISILMCVEILHKNPESFRKWNIKCCAWMDWAHAACMTKHGKSYPRYLSMLDYVHILPKCPELHCGGNAAHITIKQMVHPNRGLHNNKPICYIYASLGAQISRCAAPAAWTQSIRAQHLMFHFRKLSGFLCKISTHIRTEIRKISGFLRSFGPHQKKCFHMGFDN